jgi:hypothetical protein
MTEIPLASSGGWDPKIRAKIRRGLEGPTLAYIDASLNRR